MKHRLHSTLTVVVLHVVAALVPLDSALAVSPSLGLVMPRGGQRGTELELDLHGARLQDAAEVLFYDSGIEVTAPLEVVNDKHARAKLKIAADCRLGEHALRLRTRSGVSELRTFWIGPLPVVEEKEPNSEFASPQPVALDVTIAGVVTGEDVDCFVVEAKKGQRLTAEIEALRLGGTLFDPYVAILDAKRFELSASDDHPLVRQDSIASILVPEDGKYVVQVRESAYGGNDNCRYRLHVGTFSRPTAVVPAGGPPGAEIELRLLGDVAGELTRKVKLPESASDDFGVHPEADGGVAPAGLPLRVVGVPNAIEVEPNESHDQATAGQAPGAFNGVIERAGDVDSFRFAAKKGQVFDVRVHARSIGSPLDPVLTVHRHKGGQVAANDDSGGPDSALRLTVPDDGEYVVAVRDHLRKGGATFAYRIELTPVQAGLSVSIPQVRQYSQERQAVVVPRGNRYATLVSVARRDFGGDVVLEAAGLPAGVSMHCESMPSNLTSIPVVFEAAADAPVAGALCELGGRHADEKAGIRGGFRQAVELVLGVPNNSLYWNRVVDRVAVAVAEEAPFRIEIVEPKAPLVRNGVMNLRVRAERKEGFDDPIGLQMVFNPPGVSSQGGVSIPKGQSEASIRVTANGGAQVREWKVAVNGSADVGGGPLWVSSQLATLRVAEPHFSIALQGASVELGQEVEMFAKVEHREAFEGAATVRLVGLPPKVQAPELQVTKDTKELAFKLQVGEDSRPGKHRGVFCQVALPFAGEQISHGTGGAELRVDKPLPPKKPKPEAVAKAPPKPKPEPNPKPPQKRQLTRLERLREKFREAQEDK